MFAPRFSIRTTLIVITGFAFYFLLAGLGVRGHAWAGAIAIGVGSLAAVAIVHTSLFAFCWMIAGRAERRALRAVQGPSIPTPQGHADSMLSIEDDGGESENALPGGTPQAPSEEVRRDAK